MLKLVIKHKIFEYALNNIFDKLLLNFKSNIISIKEGDEYKIIGHKLENGTIETYYNGIIKSIFNSELAVVQVSYEKYTYSTYGGPNIYTCYPESTSHVRYLSMYQITSIVK